MVANGEAPSYQLHQSITGFGDWGAFFFMVISYRNTTIHINSDQPIILFWHLVTPSAVPSSSSCLHENPLAPLLALPLHTHHTHLHGQYTYGLRSTAHLQLQHNQNKPRLYRASVLLSI